MNRLRKKYGIAIVMDALGAKQYSDEKIKKFLSARAELNAMIDDQVNDLKTNYSKNARIPTPTTFTFGDTLIIVCELRSKKLMQLHIAMVLMLLQNYLFHSLEHGILFRGAYSIGTFIEDSESNTVMGEAITDAASWYEKSDWFGLVSTPRTNSILEYHFHNDKKQFLCDPLFTSKYPVPMKDGREIELYSVSWPGRFFQDNAKDPERAFLNLIKEQLVPIGTERKHINSKKYFYHVAQSIKAKLAKNGDENG